MKMNRQRPILPVLISFGLNHFRLCVVLFPYCIAVSYCQADVVRTVTYSDTFQGGRPSSTGGPNYKFYFTVQTPQPNSVQSTWLLDEVPQLNAAVSAPAAKRDEMASLLTGGSNLFYVLDFNGWNPTSENIELSSPTISNNTPNLTNYHIDDIRQVITAFSAPDGTGAHGDQVQISFTVRYDIYGTPLPEPHSLVSAMCGLAGLSAVRRRRITASAMCC